jgi:ATP sulfurylase
MKTTLESKKQWAGPVEPHGGSLINLLLAAEKAGEWRARQKSLTTIVLDNRSLADVEMLAIGGFSPLKGFMGKPDYDSVIDSMCLANGLAWTIPVTLAVSREEAERLKVGQPIGLLEGTKLIAVLHLQEIYEAERPREAMGGYRTQETAHPGVGALYAKGEILLGGSVEVLELP